MQEYAAGRASENEVEELFELLKSVEHEDVLYNLITQEGANNDPGIGLPQQKWDEMWMAISTTTATRRQQRVSPMQWISIAAAILVIVAAGFYFFSGKRERTAGEPVTEKHDMQHDVAPGGNKALLTLADGSTIVLDSTQNGLLAQQGNMIVIKLDNGQLAYKPGVLGQEAGAVGYNTIATPRGGQYHVVLPDGSGVWLNASSSLRFPASFAANERRVELTGEAYFEIASLPASPGGGGKGKRPFKVLILPQPGGQGGGEVEVTGTHFNIMAYPNEQSTKTTLLEGSVKVRGRQSGVSSQEPAVVLKPGQQAQMGNDKLSVINNVNLDQVIAWKNGLFRFKDTDIKELMRQVERWYDVEVEYQTKRTDQVYTGIVARSENLSSVLQLLELTGTVHFRVEGKKITVLP